MTPERHIALKCTSLSVYTQNYVRSHTHSLYGLNTMIYDDFFHQEPELTDHIIHTKKDKNVFYFQAELMSESANGNTTKSTFSPTRGSIIMIFIFIIFVGKVWSKIDVSV